MLNVKLPKNRGVLHFKKQLKKMSDVDGATKQDSHALSHYSAIINPKLFASKFKDLSFCVRCAMLILGKVKIHNCLAPLPINSPILNKRCEDLLNYFDVNTLMDFRDPSAQMLSSISYEHLKEELECSACGRWRLDIDLKKSGDPAPIFIRWQNIKRKVLFGKEIQNSEQYQLMPQALSCSNFVKRLSRYHRQHTFCIVNKNANRLQLDPCCKCFRQFRSVSCKVHHQEKKGCGQYFTCHECLMSYPRKEMRPYNYNYKEWVKKHTHLETICPVCKQRVLPSEAKNHACPLKTYCNSENYRRLACFDFETSCDPNSPDSYHEAIF